MTPDMKRLCEAALLAQGVTKDRGYCWSIMTEGGSLASETEKVVRAVLIALREPSESLEEACRGIVIAAGGDNWDIDYKADQMRAAMIDHILGTETRRAAALQDLADIDRDLL